MSRVEPAGARQGQLSNLPERASYEHLTKLAKERLELLRMSNPASKLADAQLALAPEYGFSGWRALKSEMGRREHRMLLCRGLITCK